MIRPKEVRTARLLLRSAPRSGSADSLTKLASNSKVTSIDRSCQPFAASGPKQDRRRPVRAMGAEPAVLGIDVGQSGARAEVVVASGRVLGSGVVPVRVRATAGRAEQD